MVKKLTMLVAMLALVASLGTPANALLSALSPTNDPVSGFPVWIQDANGVALMQCTLGDGLTGPCVFGAPDPTNPFSVQLGWDAEMFYFIASETFTLANPVGGNGLVLLGIEAAFLPTTAPGNQFLFSRIRWRLDAPVAGTYKLTHPYGILTQTVVTPGTRAINFTSDIGGLPPTYLPGILNGEVGPFLTAVNPPPPLGFLGSPLIEQTYTGSPLGTNFIRIDGPPGCNIGGPGVDFVQSNTATISGRIFNGALPSPLSVTRATYNRAVDGSGQVDVFAVSAPNAALNINASGVIPATPMLGDGAGIFFGHVDLPDATVLPATVTVTADNSVAAPTQTPTTLGSNLVDLVVVNKAQYDLTTRTLNVAATSSDLLTNPALTLLGIGGPAGTPMPGGVASVAIGSAPPNVSIASAAGGTYSKEPVNVVRLALAPGTPPLAGNDSVTTKQPNAVVINVLANDTAATGSTLNPASVTVGTAPLHGTTAINTTTGAITYTPAPTYFGPDTFTYTVQDTTVPTPLTSNVATVSITVSPALVAPTAVNDTATTAFQTPVAIPVIANDTTPNAGATINPATVLIATPAVSGTTAINTTTGAVTYTPNAGFTGADSFAYTVQDSLGALSNIANVAITVAAGPPTAVNDTAFSNGVTISIPVLANDTAPGSTLNPASVTIVTAPLRGTASVNTVTGAINYTPANGFGGTDTLNYAVRNAAGVVSNIATVTIGVEAIKIGSAQYTTLLRSWSISGNSTVRTGETMTFYVGSTTTGTVIGTASVGTNGNFTFSQTGSAVSPGTARTISCKSSTGGTVLGFPLQVR